MHLRIGGVAPPPARRRWRGEDRLLPDASRRDLQHERLPEGKVQVDGAGGRACGRGDRAAGEGAYPAHGLGRCLRGAHLDEPSRVRAEQPELVDRLPRTTVAQLGRPVGGEDNERHLRVERLDHGGHEVGGRGARRAGEDNGRARHLGDPEGEETGRTFVHVRPCAQPRMTGDRQREWRRAAPGGDAGMADARADELVDQECGRQVAAVGAGH